VAGVPLDVMIDGKAVKLLVSELPWRHFAQAGVQFDYPRHYPWESDATPPRSWTLDGNDSVIMLFEQAAGAARTPESLADGLERALAAKAPERGKAVLRTTRAGTLTGIVSTVKLATSTITNEVFSLQAHDRSSLLVLQDSLDDAGNHSSEYIEMRQRLSATLEF
jgi:hypothetical protein